MAGEPPKKFSTHTGIPLKNIYTPEDIKDLDYDRDLGYPGKPPYTRGVYETMYRGQAFTLRRFSGVETPEKTNQLFLDELRLGQTGLSLAVDVPTCTGLDSDNSRCEWDIGHSGVPIDTIEDMEIVFKDISIDKVTCWVGTPAVVALYFAMAERRGIDLKILGGSTPAMGVFVPSFVDQPFQVAKDGELRLAMDFAEWTYNNVPKWHNTSLTAYGVKELGFDCFQELGTLMAASITAADMWKARGKMPLENFFKRISFEFANGSDFFEEACKYRAARRMWTKICQRYGLTDPKLMQFRFRTQTAGATNVAQEPLNNIVRIAYEMLSAILGGAQALHPNGYDEALCIPTDASMLISIRTMQILSEETNVTSVVDPLGGSYYVEWLTNQIEKGAWDYCNKIMDMGGTIQATKSGFYLNEFKKANYRWDQAVNTGEKVIVGVNKYRMKPEEVPYKVPIYRYNADAGTEKIAKLKKYKQERNNKKVQDALARMEKACLSKDENIFEYMIQANRAGATLQESYDVCRKVYGLDPALLMKV